MRRVVEVRARERRGSKWREQACKVRKSSTRYLHGQCQQRKSTDVQTYTVRQAIMAHCLSIQKVVSANVSPYFATHEAARLPALVILHRH